MIDLRRVSKEHQEAGPLNALVNVHSAIDEHTFLTKSGELLVMLKAHGVDAECLDDSHIDQVARRFEHAISTFGEPFRIHQYVVKRDHPPIPRQDHKDEVVHQATANRIAYLENRKPPLSSVDLYFGFSYDGLTDPTWDASKLPTVRKAIEHLRVLFSTERNVGVSMDALDRARDTLRTKVNAFVVQLKDTVPLELLDREQGFRFLRRLLNFAPYKADAVGLRHNSFVDFQACDSALECYRDHLRLDNYYVQALTLKEPPPRTFANFLGALLEIPGRYILASEWRRRSNASMRRIIQNMRRHHHNSKASFLNYLNSSDSAPKDMLIDSSATALVAELGSCLEAMEVEGNAFGEFSMTAILYDEDQASLRKAVAECFKVFGSSGASLTEERYNLLNSFLAVLPGNHAFNLRRMWLLDTNYADLSFLFAPDAGELVNRHLGTEYLAVLETNQWTPYFLNLHHQDVPHTLILGATGSGKSLLVNFLITHLQKYGALTRIFDLGDSYEDLTRLFGGTYVTVGPEARTFTINPFSLPPTQENLQFLFSFVRVLAESSGYQFTAHDETDLYEQIKNMYSVEPSQRRLLTLAGILNRNIRQGLQKWTQGGQYGALFDNAEDTLTFARFQTFDFAGMDRNPQILEPFLFYVLHRANASIDDPELATTFKIFVIDEAWRFFRHPTIKAYIVEALKTWRKKNAGVILATQSSDDLLRSEMLAIVAESCPTKMFLANPGMDKEGYREVFHLNEREAERIAQLIPKQQILVKRPGSSKVVNLNVDPKEYWLYTTNPFDVQKKREAFARYGFEEGLEILARSKP